MLKKSKKPGKSTLAKAEVQNISNHGIWILVNEQEFFMPFSDFPWFLKATIEQIYKLEFFNNHHLHWPALDIDIDVDALKHPEAYPLSIHRNGNENLLLIIIGKQLSSLCLPKGCFYK